MSPIIKNSTNNNQTTVPSYNNCFTLGAKSKRDNGAIIKVPAFIDSDGYPAKLWGGKGGALSRYYALSYDRAKNILERYLNGSKRVRGDESLRVSLYLDNAMFGDLHIFVIDFDRFDENSGFFQSAKNLANKVTRSQGGGWHMYYGINKETAAPLFDSINLLASRAAKSFVRSTVKSRFSVRIWSAAAASFCSSLFSLRAYRRAIKRKSAMSRIRRDRNRKSSALGIRRFNRGGRKEALS